MERRTKRTSLRKSEGREKDKDLFLREFRKKICRFCKDKTPAKDIDYKDLNRLSRFITERGKIVSRRLSGTCAKHQRKVAEALRLARFLALIR